LREAVADGPVLFRGVENVHEHVLGPDAGILAEQFRDENARQAFADLMTRIIGLVQQALSEGAARGEFNGDPKIAALHIATVTRGLAVLERAFGDEAELRRIAKHTVDLVLGKGRS
jgi:hypothetical protein